MLSPRCRFSQYGFLFSVQSGALAAGRTQSSWFEEADVENRWVHCCHCGQTYAAGLGPHCSLCGLVGGLSDVPRPPPNPNASERDSREPAGESGGQALAGGCLGVLAGAALGIMIALGLPAHEARTVAQAGADGQQCGTGLAILLFWDLVGRAVLGVTLGSIVGAVAGLFISTRAGQSSPPTRPE